MHKKLNKNKGFIFIYVILLGNIVVMLSLFMFSMETYAKKYNLDMKKYVIRNDVRSNNTEYLLGKINFIINTKILCNNQNKLDIEKIKAYFKNNSKIVYNESYFEYGKMDDDNYFEVVTILNNNYIFRDIYKFNVKGDRYYFKYVYTRKNN